MLVRRFQIQTMLPAGQARATSPVGLAASSIHLGASATDFSGKSKAPTREESPSLSAQDRQQTEHESRDLTKKKLLSAVKKDKG